MRIRSRRLLPIIVAAAFIASRGFAATPTGNFIRWIQRPLFSQSAIALRGGTVIAHTLLPEGVPVSAVRLICRDRIISPPFEELRLPGSSTTSIYIKVHADAPPGIYDLEMLYGTKPAPTLDVQPRALAVYASFPQSFDFAAVSDIHYGDIRGNMTDFHTDFNAIRGDVLDAVNRSPAAVVLVPGDLTFAPFTFQHDYPAAYEAFLGHVTRPVFLVPGNHDMYRAGFGGREMGDGKEFWARTFGPEYYSFDFGRVHFIGLNTYDWPAKYRSAGDQKTMRASGSLTEGVIGDEQFRWLTLDIKKARQRGQRIVVFGHHPPETFTTGPMLSDPNFHGAKDLFSLLRRGGVRAYICGHVHANREETYDGVSIFTVGTAGSDTGETDWGYRLFHVQADGKITGRAIPVVHKKDVEGRR